MEIWAFAGGKGGTGKTFIASNICLALAFRGKRVIAVDADLGGANLHTFLGKTYPEKTLGDFLLKRVSSIQDIILTTPNENLRMIGGASDILSLANPIYSQKMKIIRNILSVKADHLVLDIGAGSNNNVLDFFGMADKKIIVVTSEPTSIQNAYGLIKCTLLRKILKRLRDIKGVDYSMLKREIRNTTGGIKSLLKILGDSSDSREIIEDELKRFKAGMIVNMADSPVDGKVAKVIDTIVKGFLNIDLTYLGSIPEDKRVRASIERTVPYLIAYPSTGTTTAIYRILDSLLSWK